MKTKDVKVGGTYFTVIGSELAAVVVVREIPGTPGDSFYGRQAGRTRFEVKRVGSDRCLPGYRTAAALRLENRKFF